MTRSESPRDPTLAPLYDEAFLSRLTARLIESGKHRQAGFIVRIAGLVPGLDPSLPPRALLAKILLHVHPDKVKAFGAWVDGLVRLGQRGDLEKLRGLAAYDRSRPPSALPPESLEGLEELWEPDPADAPGLEEDNDTAEVVDEELEHLSITEALRFSEYGHVEVEVDYGLSGPEYEELIQPDMGIEDIAGIGLFPNLRLLDLSRNLLEDIDEIGELASLEELYLGENRVTDLLLLSACKRLRILDLSQNRVRDLSSLLELPELEYVNLTGNPVDPKQAAALEARGVMVVR
ncbi:MAG: leucine-rich repeat domain-containing protein [Spirochaetes bacterium]|nr:leucine-rich repeat domain-containing protein [Spirochaetota bacterium]